MQRSRFRVITKGKDYHAIVDRSTGKTFGIYSDDQKAWDQVQSLNSQHQLFAAMPDRRRKSTGSQAGG